MKIKTGTDATLRNLLRAELRTLHEYEEMFDEMTEEEKNELCGWMAQGNSVNSNPHLLYGENGCLMDFLDASRTSEDMVANPDYYRQWANPPENDELLIQDPNMPF